MTRDQFIAAGRALYGNTWQSEMARALGVGDRTVRRMAAGEMAVSDKTAHEIVALCAERGAALVDIAIDLLRPMAK